MHEKGNLQANVEKNHHPQHTTHTLRGTLTDKVEQAAPLWHGRGEAKVPEFESY